MPQAQTKQSKILAVYLDLETHRRLRMIAAERDASIGVYAREVLVQFVAEHAGREQAAMAKGA